jgi:hypothetical protein
MKAKLLLPNGNYSGNLLWRKAELHGKESQLALSVKRLSELEYWASSFPEGDGVTFNDKGAGRPAQQILDEFREAFPWLDVSMGTHGSSNQELADLESEASEANKLDCIVIVPIAKVHFEIFFELGPFRFVCNKELDDEPHERLADWEGSYLQFETQLEYTDLLRLNRHVSDNDVVILKCLTLAEQAMDVVRFEFSSFDLPHFTPNPAGQLDDGTYAVEIIPLGQTHLKPVNLRGISRPMSASNNWLGPEIDDHDFPAREYLMKVLDGQSDVLALSVKSMLRSCRQAFYTLGDGSRFLTLVFALDGLVHPAKNWTGWKHRTYIAALISHGDVKRFHAVLVRYDELYSDVRNALVHHGKDFFELAQDSAVCCQDLYGYISDVVNLIADFGFINVHQLHEQATQWLTTSSFVACYQQVIPPINLQRQSQSPVPNW